MTIKQGDMTGAPIPVGAALSKMEQPVEAILSADVPARLDRLERAPSALLLAEVVAHRSAETPFCIGIFGSAGSGKSTVLNTMLGSVDRLDAAAETAGIATPFQSKIAIARVLCEPGVAPSTSLVRQVSAALASRFPRLVSEAVEAGFDARAAARDANERLNETRQKLDAERRALDALMGRQAALTDTVLFEMTGSRIDSYARGARGRIERTARGFGIGGDPLVAYKSAVRESSEASGSMPRWTGWLRGLWAYRGQGRLLALAAALLLAAWGTGALIGNEPKIIDAVRSGGEKMGSLADWMENEWHWLHPLRRMLELAALAALVVNIVRALRFLLPIHRGVGLLRTDLDARRRDLDGLLAHQTRRVDTLAREVEIAGQRVAAAERRLLKDAGEEPVHSSVGLDAAAEAQAFFSALGRAMGDDAWTADAPARVVVAIDGLEQLQPREAFDFLQVARRLVQRPGFVTILAAERLHLAAGIDETDPALVTAFLDRLIQIPFTLEQEGDGRPDAAALARALLADGPASTARLATVPADAAISALDRPWTSDERATVEALAPWAGRTPRSVKRFVNLYRIARADPRMSGASPDAFVALALGFASQAAGQAFEPNSSFGSVAGDGLQQARDALTVALGKPFDGAQAGPGYDVARTYWAGH